MLVFGFLCIIAFGACLSNSFYLDRKDAPIKAVRFPLKRQVLLRSDMPWEAKKNSGRSLSTYVANAHVKFPPPPSNWSMLIHPEWVLRDRNHPWHAA